MDLNDIERLRVEGFTIARRGYDRREVDKFLGALAYWLETEAATDLGGTAVKRKLELAGKSTAQILLTTEKEAEQMRLQAEEECSDLRLRAEADALGERRAAEDYAQKQRERADRDARKATETANAMAQKTIEEGQRRRAQLDALIAELETRRDESLRELGRLHGELTSTIEKHASGPAPTTPSGAEDGERPQRAKRSAAGRGSR